jgi:hypothetical protein
MTFMAVRPSMESLRSPARETGNLPVMGTTHKFKTEPLSGSAGLTGMGIPVKWWANDIPKEK